MALDTKNGWVDGVDQVNLEVRRHFKSLFQEPNIRRPNLDGVSFKQLLEEEKELLGAQFTNKEIEEVA